MVKHFRFLSAVSLLTVILFVKTGPANANELRFELHPKISLNAFAAADTIPPSDVMDAVTAAIEAINSFELKDVADLYTPNAVIADDEAPYSWNGPTAGVQWINAIERACKNNRLTNLKGRIEPINFFQQSEDNFYIVVPVSFSGNLPGKRHFSVKGAFTFVLRQQNGKWLIKSQTWMQQKAINGG